MNKKAGSDILPFVIITIVAMVLFYDPIKEMLSVGTITTDSPLPYKTEEVLTEVPQSLINEKYRTNEIIEPLPVNYTLDIGDLTDTSLLDT